MAINGQTESPPLALVDVTAAYNGHVVLDGTTLPLARGRITVLIGPSGAGKTTCVRHLVGLATPLGGSAMIEGRDVGQMSDEELRREQRRMSVMLQGSSLFGCALSGSSTVFDNVAFPLRAREPLGEEEIAELVHHRLEEVGIAERADALPEELSAGMVRRVALARALVSCSEIVVLDDVESGLDRQLLRGVIESIHSEHRRTGATFLVVTHDGRLALELAEVLAVLRGGRIEALGSPEEVLADRTSFAARFLVGDPAAQSEIDGDRRRRDSRPPGSAADEPSDRKVSLALAAFVISMGALLLTVLIATVLFFDAWLLFPN